MDRLKGDAFLRARERYEDTGDIRYAALAIGKSDGEIPDWALEACKSYARQVGHMPSRSLKKGRAVNERMSGYEEAYEELINYALSQTAGNKPFIFADAVKHVLGRRNILGSPEQEAWQKDLRRRWNDDLDPADTYSPNMWAAVDAGDLDPPENEFARNRRIKAVLVMRARGLSEP